MPVTPIKILVAEDLEEDRRLLASFLMSKGYSVYLACNGLEAFRIAKKVLPDLILMDINMPEQDGYTTMLNMQNEPELHNTPVIFITAANSPSERVKGLEFGAIDYVIKPFDFQEVALRLERHLHYRQVAPTHTRGNSHKERLENALFTAACMQISSNLAAEINSNSLAQKLNTNTKRLNEAFKACAGVTVSEHLRSERLSEAKRLLSESFLDVQDIANLVGYNNPANFSTAFQNQWGVSPSQFRKQFTEH